MKHCTPLRATALAGAALLAFLLAAAGARAQQPDVGGSWRDIDLVRAAGVPSETRGTREDFFHFYDALNGIRALRPNVPGADDYLATSDGGATWRPTTSPGTLPDGRLDDGFAWLRSGATSTDGGRTWRTPAIETADFTAASRLALTALRRSAPGPVRLVTSSDGGASWRALDSLDAGGVTLAASVFGALPSPATMDDASVAWAWLVAQRGGAIDIVTTATGTIDGAGATVYYLTTLDLDDGTISAIELPMWRGGPPLFTERPMPIRPGAARLIVPELELDRYLGEWRLRRLWTSDDAGTSWTRHDSLLWIDLARLRFFSETLGITSNAKTTDGGRTWRRLGRPFGSAFFALDSSRWFVADTFDLTGRTTDGGRTWSRSIASSPLRAIIAHRGNVAIARAQRSVLASSDGGATWTDVGADGGLPDDLAQIVAMTFVDTLELPGRAEGIGAFIDEEGRRSARAIHSDDYGRTWREGGRLAMLDSAVFAGDAIEFPILMQSAPGIEGASRVLFVGGLFGLLASTDDGATWERRSPDVPIYGMAMTSGRDGVVMSGDWAIPGVTLHRTSDGGRTWEQTFAAPDGYTFPIGLQLLEEGYRAMIASNTSGYREWLVVSSEDGGAWSARRTAYAGPALKGGGAFWSDTRRVHVVGRGASVLFSNDGGMSLTVHHDSLRRFFHPLLSDPTNDMIFRPLMTARDGFEIYVATYHGDLGRWTIGNDVLAVSGDSPRDAPALTVWIDGGVALVRARGSDVHDLAVVDMLGRSTPLESQAQSSGILARLDLTALAPGAYLVVARRGALRLSAPFSVVR
jgi:photosystem II stability/assembly factor-like uncharacterized protein